MTDLPPVIEQLVRCGLKAEGLRVEFEPVLQSDVVTVTPRARADASMFVSIRHAIWAIADIEFEDERLGGLFREFDRAVTFAESRAQARAWLAEQGRLPDLPVLAENDSPASIMEKVERFCSIPPGAALELHGEFIALKPGFLDPTALEDFELLLNTMSAIDLERHGLSFGFIGNAAAAESDQG